MIVAWQRADGPRKDALLAEIFRLKQGLIRQLTAKYARTEKTAEHMDDLVQAGCIGFRRALEGFDPARQCAISTYAGWWIRKEVQRVAQAGRVVSLPRIRVTNEERSRAVVALRENPDVAPESIGIKRNHLEQIRHSIGVKFLSDDTPRGAAAMERQLREDRAFDAGVDSIEAARRRRRMNGVLARVRMGKTAVEIGISGDAYEAALEVIRDEQPEPEDTMDQTTPAAETPATVKKRPGPKPGRGRARVSVVAAPKGQDAKKRLAARLSEVQAEAKLLEFLLAAPEDAVARVVAAFAS